MYFVRQKNLIRERNIAWRDVEVFRTIFRIYTALNLLLQYSRFDSAT
jgi:hypothetical protein